MGNYHLRDDTVSALMHITLVSTSYPVHHDGSEAAGSFVEDFSRALARHVAVTVVAPAPKAGTILLDDILQVIYFKVARLPLSSLNPFNPFRWPSVVSTMQRGRRTVLEVVRSKKSDHIMALWALPSGYWAMKAGERTNTRFSTWALGSDIWSLGEIPVIRGQLAKVLRHAQLNFADGLKLSRQVKVISGSGCAFLPSSRDLGVTTPPQRGPGPPWRVAFLGRWHANKGIDLLLDALKLLSDEDWLRIRQFDLAGGGPLNDLVQARCEALRAEGKPVRLHGYLNRDAARDYLLNTDFVVIPSRIESIPVIFSDCLQAGCTVITTPVGDLPELLTQHDVGELCQAATAPAIADGIRRALGRGPAEPARLNEAAHSFSVTGAVNIFLKSLGVS